MTLVVGRRGATPISFEYSFEPFAGTVCSNGTGSFASQILVKAGQEVKQGEVIARFTTVGSSAHIHFNLKADGATICPEIFPTSTIQALTETSSITASCAALHTTGNLCVQPSSSEDPARIAQ
jgi:pyruvate/2-oxoglutarate dehydrogenase complex dihydrolipoamide acyltransferase (E2) component